MATKKSNNKKLKLAEKLISPAQAMKWITAARDAGFVNRKVQQRVVERYARDMKNGNWKLTADAIKFVDGIPVDGFHRLHACVLAQVSFRTVIAEGVEREAVDAMDDNIRRTYGHKLEMKGMTDVGDGGQVATAARLIWLHDTSLMSQTSIQPSFADIQATLTRHPGIVAAVVAARDARQLIPPGQMGALHYLFTQIDAARAANFLEALASGELLTKEDPVYKLRDFLIKNSQAKRKYRGNDILARVIKAWNWTGEGRVMNGKELLMWRNKGKRAEPFPTIR